MSGNGLVSGPDEIHEAQTGLGLDDGAGLRVVSAKFLSEEKFDWDLFDGYQDFRVLTYSASVRAIVRMLDTYSFTNFECVFGFEGALRDIKDILAFQKVVVGDTRAAIMALKDERHLQILEKVHAGRCRSLKSRSSLLGRAPASRRKWRHTKLHARSISQTRLGHRPQS
jgi:hypothetical protein